MQANKYQSEIYQQIEHGDGNLIVAAYAGSGKTTTLVQAASLIQSSGVFVAFNKAIAEELDRRLPSSMSAINFHKLGYRALAKMVGGKLDPKTDKYRRACKAWYDQHHSDLERAERAQKAYQMAQAIGFLHRTMTPLPLNPTDDQIATVEDVLAHFDVYVHPSLYDPMGQIMGQGRSEALTSGYCDFDEMIAIPAQAWLNGDSRLFPTYNWVFVDEAQDLNAPQAAIAGALSAPGGRMVFVGDPRQAIYGFTGADSQSMARLRERYTASELPLSVCYRCPQSVIREAQTLVPGIEAAPNAPEGTVGIVTERDFYDRAEPGDMVLCRLNAPLMRETIGMIARGIPARMEGRDLGRALGTILESIEKRRDFVYSEQNLMRGVHQWEDQQVQYLLDRDANATSIEAVRDKAKALRVCIDSFGDAGSVTGVVNGIESLFDERRPHVKFSSVHRAKGLEAPRVYILEGGMMPLPNTDGWQLEQEYNLKYVAITRAQNELLWVANDGTPDNTQGTESDNANATTEQPAPAEQIPLFEIPDIPAREPVNTERIALAARTVSHCLDDISAAMGGLVMPDGMKYEDFELALELLRHVAAHNAVLSVSDKI